MERVKHVWQKLPLGSKLAALASLLVVVVVLALTWLTVQRERTSFQQELSDQAFLMLETLSLTMRDSLYWLHLDELQDTVNKVSDNENVNLFIIYDKKGQALVDAVQSRPVFSSSTDPLGETLINLAPDEFYHDWRQGQFVAGRVVMLGNQRIGAIAIGLSTENLDTKIAALGQQSALLALAVMAISIVVAFWLARQITNSLGELTRVAADMAAGDLSRRVKSSAGDEIGRLSDAFNQMADAIERRESKLRDLAAGLERTVTARTAELRQQNETMAQTNRELNQARKQAEKANHDKSAFLSIVSHELRTPLTSVFGFARLIQRRLDQVIFPALAPEPKVQRAVEQVKANIAIIVSEGERLTDLINQMLDLARIESGKTEWDMRPLIIQDMLERAAAATTALFEGKALTFSLQIEPNLPAAFGDYNRLIQVLINLISNAVKFTDAGSVTCRAALLAPPDSAGRQILISVIDTGIGISPENQTRIFEQFVQVDQEQSGRPRGTGLGLPICKSIVEHHGGRIWVQSQGIAGAGSTFSFTLPAQ